MEPLKRAMNSGPIEVTSRPTQAEAEEAVRVLLRWAGDVLPDLGVRSWLLCAPGYFRSGLANYWLLQR